jgi:hypothetical protein
MRRGLAVVFLLGAACAAAAPPDHEPSWELGVFGGASLLNAEGDVDVVVQCFAAPCPPVRERRGVEGSGLLGAQMGVRAARAVVIEGSLTWAPSHHVTQDGQRFDDSLSAYHVDVGARYELSRSGVRPFLSIGAGYIAYRGGSSLPRVDGHDWSVNIGAGLGFRLASGVRARIDVVDHVVSDQAVTRQTAHDVHMRVGVTFLR